MLYPINNMTTNHALHYQLGPWLKVFNFSEATFVLPLKILSFSTFLYLSLPVSLSVCFSVSVCQSDCLFVWLFVCLSVHVVSTFGNWSEKEEHQFQHLMGDCQESLSHLHQDKRCENHAFKRNVSYLPLNEFLHKKTEHCVHKKQFPVSNVKGQNTPPTIQHRQRK